VWVVCVGSTARATRTDDERLRKAHVKQGVDGSKEKQDADTHSMGKSLRFSGAAFGAGGC
jgi:hypothetical protein